MNVSRRVNIKNSDSDSNSEVNLCEIHTVIYSGQIFPQNMVLVHGEAKCDALPGPHP